MANHRSSVVTVADEHDASASGGGSDKADETAVQRLALDLVRAWLDNKPSEWTALVTKAHEQGAREVVEALGAMVEALLGRIATGAGTREMMEVLADQVALLLVRIAHQTGSTPKATLEKVLGQPASPADPPG